MPKIARNEFEAEAERAQIAAILVKAGPDASAVEVWRLVNEERYARALGAALAAGKSQEEAERAAQAARIGVHTVRRDIRILIGRAQRTSVGGIAVFLQDQIDAVRDEIEATYLMDEQITLDLERSRNGTWRRTRSVRTKVTGEDGKQTAVVEPAEQVRFETEDGAGAAALWGRLQVNMARRAELRAEWRSLQFSMLSLPEPESAGAAEEPTLPQRVTGLDDPAAARRACLLRLDLEIRELRAAASLPMPKEMVALDRMRSQALAERLANIRSIREYVEEADREDGGTFEVSFVRLEPRQLPAVPADAAQAPEEAP